MKLLQLAQNATSTKFVPGGACVLARISSSSGGSVSGGGKTFQSDRGLENSVAGEIQLETAPVS